MSAYFRKARDEWEIQGNYGYGWDVVCSEDKLRAALATLREYRENEPQYAHRLRKVRVPIMSGGAK